MGNPFLDDFPELVTLDSRDCMDDAVVKAVVNLEHLGKMQYQDFVKAVIKDRRISICDPIKKNKAPPLRKTALAHEIQAVEDNHGTAEQRSPFRTIVRRNAES